MRLRPLFMLLFFLMSCDKENSPPLEMSMETVHFEINFHDIDAETITALTDELEGNYDRILEDLGLDTVFKTMVYVHNSYDELTQAVDHILPNPPSWLSGIATGRSEMHVLYPGSLTVNFRQVTLHEFAHCASRNLNNNMGSFQKWLFEGVALYEAGQFVQPSTLDYMVNEQPPTLTQLNSQSDTRIYEVGYTLIEFVVDEFGSEAIHDLIVSGGNVSVLGISFGDFQTQWYAFVQERYL